MSRYLKMNYCKICFNEINDFSLYSLVNKNNLLCESCFHKFQAKFINFNINNVHGLAIYEYDQTIKELIYKFKGCYDYELKDVFLSRYLPYLRLKYKGYLIVPMPSYYIDDEKRGYNHVIEIYKSLNLEICPLIYKAKKHKQSDHSSKGRMDISNVLKLKENVSMKGKKLLLVDDIFTTGSTLFTAIEIIKKLNPKKMEILVVAKTKYKTKKKY